jgi:hypothetical protein
MKYLKFIFFGLVAVQSMRTSAQASEARCLTVKQELAVVIQAATEGYAYMHQDIVITAQTNLENLPGNCQHMPVVIAQEHARLGLLIPWLVQMCPEGSNYHHPSLRDIFDFTPREPRKVTPLDWAKLVVQECHLHGNNWQSPSWH